MALMTLRFLGALALSHRGELGLGPALAPELARPTRRRVVRGKRPASSEHFLASALTPRVNLGV
jgi:hypothetical protein